MQQPAAPNLIHRVSQHSPLGSSPKLYCLIGDYTTLEKIKYLHIYFFMIKSVYL